MSGLYTQDLSRLGRDLRRTVLVDDTPLAFLRQPDNGIPIFNFRCPAYHGCACIPDTLDITVFGSGLYEDTMQHDTAPHDWQREMDTVGIKTFDIRSRNAAGM